LVEHLICNHDVVSSILTGGSKFPNKKARFEELTQTGAVSRAPPKEPASYSIVWRRASAPFALLTCRGKQLDVSHDIVASLLGGF
jgi:hypothetical protein